MAGIRIRPRTWRGIAEGALLLLLVVTLSWRIAADRTVGASGGETPPRLPDQTAEALLLKAQAAYDAGDLASAGAFYADILKVDDGSVVARLRLANIFHANSWNDNAMALLDEAIARDPDEQSARLLQAKIHRDEGDAALATQQYESVLQLDPHNAAAHYYLGTAYQSDRRFEDAIREYGASMRDDPSLRMPPFEAVPFGIQARLQLGRTYRQLARYAMQNDAAADAETLFELALDALRDTVARADGAQLTGYGEARSELRDTLDDKARLLRRRAADEQDILAVHEEKTRVDPDDPVAWLDAGQATMNLARTRPDVEKALEYFRTAFNTDPTYMDANANMIATQQLLEYSDEDLERVLRGEEAP